MSEDLSKFNNSRAEKDLAAIINNDESLLDKIPKSRMEELLIMLYNKCEEQDNKITEQDNKITEQDNKITEQDNKITEQDNKITEQDNKITELNGKLDVVDISSQIVFTSDISNVSCYAYKYGKIIFIRIGGILNATNTTLQIATLNGYNNLYPAVASGIGTEVNPNFGAYILNDGRIAAKSSVNLFDFNIITIDLSII